MKSEILNLNSTFMNPGGVYSPVECRKLKIVAIYSAFVFVMSVTFNSKMILLFIKHKELFNSLNIFIITIAILNIFATLGELPFIIVSNFFCRFEKLLQVT